MRGPAVDRVPPVIAAGGAVAGKVIAAIVVAGLRPGRPLLAVLDLPQLVPGVVVGVMGATTGPPVVGREAASRDAVRAPAALTGKVAGERMILPARVGEAHEAHRGGAGAVVARIDVHVPGAALVAVVPGQDRVVLADKGHWFLEHIGFLPVPVRVG